jgi:hypothetical protein
VTSSRIGRAAALLILSGAWLAAPAAAQSPAAATTLPVDEARVAALRIPRTLTVPVPEDSARWGLHRARSWSTTRDVAGQSAPQASSQGRSKGARIALGIVGAAVAGTGAYLAATAKPMWGYNPILSSNPINPRIGDFQCVDYNPYAGTNIPEVHCNSNQKVVGYIMLAGGAGVSVLGLLGR